MTWPMVAHETLHWLRGHAEMLAAMAIAAAPMALPLLFAWRRK